MSTQYIFKIVRLEYTLNEHSTYSQYIVSTVHSTYSRDYVFDLPKNPPPFSPDKATATISRKADILP